MNGSVRPAVTSLAIAIAAFYAPALTLGQEREPARDAEIVPASAKDAAPTEARPAPEAARRIVEQANQFREREKRSRLRTNDTLTATAQKFAQYMARHHRYGHSADGRTSVERAAAEGYEYCIVRENIAYQYSSRKLSVEELARRNSEGWEQSPEHRENLLDPDVTEIGVGVAQSADTGYYFAVQLVGRPKSEAIEFSLTNQSDTTIHYEVDGKPYDLQPRQIRTHTRCRPPKLMVPWPEGTEPTDQIVYPATGERLGVFGSKAKGLSLRKSASNP